MLHYCSMTQLLTYGILYSLQRKSYVLFDNNASASSLDSILPLDSTMGYSSPDQTTCRSQMKYCSAAYNKQYIGIKWHQGDYDYLIVSVSVDSLSCVCDVYCSDPCYIDGQCPTFRFFSW